MKLDDHIKAVSRVKDRLRKQRMITVRKVEIAKIQAESLKTPKGDFHLWLNSLILLSDKIWNRKLWRDYHR